MLYLIVPLLANCDNLVLYKCVKMSDRESRSRFKALSELYALSSLSSDELYSELVAFPLAELPRFC